MKKATILKARPNTKINIQAILFITIVIFTILCPGCSTYRDLHLSHMEKFQELVLAKYPSAKVLCKYEYASHVYLTVERGVRTESWTRLSQTQLTTVFQRT